MNDFPKDQVLKYTFWVTCLAGLALVSGSTAILIGAVRNQVGIVLAGIGSAALSMPLFIISVLTQIIIEKLWNLDENAVRREPRQYLGTT